MLLPKEYNGKGSVKLSFKQMTDCHIGFKPMMQEPSEQIIPYKLHHTTTVVLNLQYILEYFKHHWQKINQLINNSPYTSIIVSSKMIPCL